MRIRQLHGVDRGNCVPQRISTFQQRLVYRLMGLNLKGIIVKLPFRLVGEKPQNSSTKFQMRFHITVQFLHLCKGPNPMPPSVLVPLQVSGRAGVKVTWEKCT